MGGWPRKRVRMPEAVKPNILVVWGDDIGITNLSCYSDGLMGYRTPNIDRIADEGMRFTDSYGEQSCTAGRSSFITGQSAFRTGLSKVGLPGSPIGLQAEDPTIAELLKPHGYATGQFGKNHLGDKNEFLPTVHGFDEFFGNLYHLNAEEEPELPNYPPAEDFPQFRERFAPRGVLHAWATDDDDATEEPRWGRIGKQRIEDTGPLTKKRCARICCHLRPRSRVMSATIRTSSYMIPIFGPTSTHFRGRLASFAITASRHCLAPTTDNHEQKH